MRIGREKHDPGKQVRFKSKRGVAILDGIVEENGEFIIIERKAFKSRSVHRYIVQIITQYLIASEKIAGIRKAVLINGDRIHVFEINRDLILEVGMILERMIKAIEKDRPPPATTETWKCSVCWYSRFCPHS